jgi:hypothetical protein
MAAQDNATTEGGADSAGHPTVQRFLTILASTKVLLFREDGFTTMTRFTGVWTAILAFAVCVFFQALPTSTAEIVVFPQMYLFFLLKFALCLLVVFGVTRLFGSKARLTALVTPISLTYTYAMVVSSLLAYASIILFEQVLNVSVISGVITSFIPYYTSVLFGWCCENVSGVGRHWRAVAIGLLSITALLAYILYIDPLLCSAGVIGAFGLKMILCG